MTSINEARKTMKNIIEARTLTNIRLSDTQKVALTKIVAAPTEEVAYEELNNGRNIVAARDQLEKLGLISVAEGSAILTDEGKQVMKDENLMDETEQLTDVGQQYAAVQDPADVAKIDKMKPPVEPQQTEVGVGAVGAPQGGEEGGLEDLSMESLTLIQQIHKNYTDQHLMETLTQKPKSVDEIIDHAYTEPGFGPALNDGDNQKIEGILRNLVKDEDMIEAALNKLGF